jgi:hypothetical protein
MASRLRLSSVASAVTQKAALLKASEEWVMTVIKVMAPNPSQLTLQEVAQDTLVMAEAFLAEGGAVTPTREAVVALATVRMRVLLRDPSVTLELPPLTGKQEA